MQHNLQHSDPLFVGGAALLAHERSKQQPQERIVSAGHSVPPTWGTITNVVPEYGFTVKAHKRRTKAAPQFPKHRW